MDYEKKQCGHDRPHEEHVWEQENPRVFFRCRGIRAGVRSNRDVDRVEEMEASIIGNDTPKKDYSFKDLAIVMSTITWLVGLVFGLLAGIKWLFS